MHHLPCSTCFHTLALLVRLSAQAFLSALPALGLTQADLVASAPKMAPILLYHVIADALNSTEFNGTLYESA